ncbi:YsnF/AvaK domain-containing protein [Geminicoccus roseus]|uniref:YsnF/AvaK domain-containing protein n=1 Tax=Geminicoccus roseus TaxID=404900 RepID=UPI0003FBAF13|nr:YsnF/AvaK domain-containing protein [Geminicoccus roseus]
MNTITALYDTRGAAEAAQDGLISIGVQARDISVRGADSTAAGAGPEVEDKGFWASLGDLFMPDEDRSTYSEGLRRGGYLLTATVQEDLGAEVEEVLERSDPVDLDERSESWRQEGWTGSTGPASAAPVGSAAAGFGTGASTSGDHHDDQTIQVVDEEVRVGKRQVGGGNVRVRTYVTERPVEAQVDLHSERVTIERRPVDREVAPGVAAFQERTIEAVERGEEAVVEKVARVKEEIGLHKQTDTRTETVRDTVRETEIEIEDDRAPSGARPGH